jgi:hypothetical protein
VTCKNLVNGSYKYQWLDIEMIEAGVNKENPGLNAFRSELLDVLEKYKAKGIVNYTIFDQTKPKWQFNDTTPKSGGPSPGPSPKDSSDW